MKSKAHQARSGYLIYVVIVFIFIVIGLLVWKHFDNKIKEKTVKRDAVHSIASVSSIKVIHQTNIITNSVSYAHFSTKPTSVI